MDFFSDLHQRGAEKFGSNWLTMNIQIAAIVKDINIDPKNYKLSLSCIAYELCEIWSQKKFAPIEIENAVFKGAQQFSFEPGIKVLNTIVEKIIPLLQYSLSKNASV